jgi:hypothetical protein
MSSYVPLPCQYGGGKGWSEGRGVHQLAVGTVAQLLVDMSADVLVEEADRPVAKAKLGSAKMLALETADVQELLGRPRGRRGIV